MKESFNVTFFDKSKGLYFNGRNFKDEITQWRPCETEKRYYSVHSNTLAVLYGLCDECVSEAILEKVMNDSTLIQANPYFYHFILDALYQTGMFEKYGIKTIRKWTELSDECDKGLKEVWDGFDCDYSHAWGGTPAYQLPARILGFEIIEAGMKKIKLSPCSYGLDFAKVTMPTPYGKITAEVSKDGSSKLSVPEKITVV